jgi:hypothetical protein
VEHSFSTEHSYYGEIVKFEERLVREYLAAANGVAFIAAKNMGISYRTLMYLMKRLKIEGPVPRVMPLRFLALRISSPSFSFQFVSTIVAI